jgi:hypothetical protein
MTPNLQPVVFRGRLAAAAATDHFVLAPHIEVLELDHPERLFVSVMCFHARDVLIGRSPGPYRHAAAEMAARSTLIDAHDFQSIEHWPDAELAERYHVPLDQVDAMRRDLALPERVLPSRGG